MVKTIGELLAVANFAPYGCFLGVRRSSFFGKTTSLELATNESGQADLHLTNKPADALAAMVQQLLGHGLNRSRGKGRDGM